MEEPDIVQASVDPLEVLTEVRDDLMRMLPAVRAAISRNQAHEALVARLDDLESERGSFPQWKMARDIHRFLVRMRRTEMSVDLSSTIEEEILTLLRSQGFEEFGEVGDEFNERRHAILGEPKRSAGDRLEVEAVHARGLRWMSKVIAKAQVTICYTEDDRN